MSFNVTKEFDYQRRSASDFDHPDHLKRCFHDEVRVGGYANSIRLDNKLSFGSLDNG